MTDPVDVGFAILFAGLLLLMLWKWFRAAPGAADRRTLPLMIWLMTSMLLPLVQKLFWPSATVLHWIILVLSLIISIIVVAAVIRRDRRRLSKSVQS
jgi:hypothetical protein